MLSVEFSVIKDNLYIGYIGSEISMMSVLVGAISLNICLAIIVILL